MKNKNDLAEKNAKKLLKDAEDLIRVMKKHFDIMCNINDINVSRAKEAEYKAKFWEKRYRAIPMKIRKEYISK